MIDKLIVSLLKDKNGTLDPKPLLRFMEDTGIDFKDRSLCGPIGMATCYCIYLDAEKLIRNYNSMMIEYVIIHEIGHYKRIQKIGKDHVIKMLSLDDFDMFCNHIIEEEIIADRYSCYVYNLINKRLFPREATQQLELPYNKSRYRQAAQHLFGRVKGTEESYIKLMESFIV